MNKLLLSLFAGLALSSAAAIRPDEHVIFFPSFASQQGSNWLLSIHGWVHEPEQRPVLGALLRRAIPIDRDKLTDVEREIFRERTRYFLPDNERNKRIRIQVGPFERRVPRTSADGHFTWRWVMSGAEFSSLAISNQAVSVRALLEANDRRAFIGSIHVLSNAGFSVISDIDDTIKISEVRSRDALLRNTFCRPFAPAPGMAELYRQWQTNGAQFHYVSASPWQLFIPLAEFIGKGGFPPGTFHMKNFRLKDSTFLALMGDPVTYKLKVLRPFFEQFPNRQFILVGDSGEKDPEIYGTIAREFPTQVKAIMIRNVTDENAASARYKEAFRGLPPAAWQVFTSPAELSHVNSGLSSLK